MNDFATSCGLGGVSLILCGYNSHDFKKNDRKFYPPLFLLTYVEYIIYILIKTNPSVILRNNITLNKYVNSLFTGVDKTINLTLQ